MFTAMEKIIFTSVRNRRGSFIFPACFRKRKFNREKQHQVLPLLCDNNRIFLVSLQRCRSRRFQRDGKKFLLFRSLTYSFSLSLSLSLSLFLFSFFSFSFLCFVVFNDDLYSRKGLSRFNGTLSGRVGTSQV